MLTELILVCGTVWAVIATCGWFATHLERNFWRDEAEQLQIEMLKIQARMYDVKERMRRESSVN